MMTSGRLPAAMRPVREWQELVDEPGTDRHVVQLYRDEAGLARVVGAWLAKPLLRGGGALLACTPQHAALLREALVEQGVDVAAADREGALVVLDARETLARFVRAGEPRAELFAPLVRRAVQRVRAASPRRERAEVRAWGEMVDVLWHEDRKDAARRLEPLWNEAIDALDFRLLCSYRVENLDARVQEELAGICAGHSLLVPEEDVDALDAAVSAALVDVFGEAGAGVVRATYARTRAMATQMPAAQAVLHGLQLARPADAARVLDATRRRMLGA
jgi:hypothetical protein